LAIAVDNLANAQELTKVGFAYLRPTFGHMYIQWQYLTSDTVTLYQPPVPAHAPHHSHMLCTQSV